MFREDRRCAQSFTAGKHLSCNLCLGLFNSRVHASALSSAAEMLKHVGEEKGPFSLLTFSRVVRADAIF